MTTAVIVDAVRTAGGKRNGKLRNWHAVDLASEALKAVAERNQLDPAQVDDVIMGCVMQVAEQSLNIGRNAVLAAGWPESVPGTTVDRQCGSSQQAVHFAAQGVMAGRLRHRDRRRRGVDDEDADGLLGRARLRVPLRAPHDAALHRDRAARPGHRRRDDRRPVGHLARRARRLLGAEPPARRPGHGRGPVRERDRARRRPRRRGQRHRRDADRRRGHPAGLDASTRWPTSSPPSRRRARSRPGTPRRSPTVPPPCSS